MLDFHDWDVWPERGDRWQLSHLGFEDAGYTELIDVLLSSSQELSALLIQATHYLHHLGRSEVR